MSRRMRDRIPLPLRHRLATLRQHLQGWLLAWKFSRQPFERVQGRPAVLVAADGLVEGAVTRGGRVKLAGLQQAFPGCFDAFNILYLVSSALPTAPEAWIARARRGGARVVWNQNGVGYPAWAGARAAEFNRPMRRHIVRTDRVLYQSEFCKRASEAFLGPARAGDLVLHNAVDTRRFVPQAVALAASPPVLLMAGSHQVWYRVETALETARILEARGFAFRLRIAGPLEFEGGIERTRAAIHARGLEERVELEGSYSRDQAPELFRRAHLLLHTQYQDACPSVLLEAMASGLPVVASASGGIPELVGQEAGVLVPAVEDWEQLHPPDPEPLADGVTRVMSALGAYSSAARRRMLDLFDETAWIEAHRRIFEDLLGGPGS